VAVFLALVLGSLAARIAGRLGVGYVDSWPSAIAFGLALMFFMTGVAHFTPGMRRDMISSTTMRDTANVNTNAASAARASRLRTTHAEGSWGVIC